MANDVLFKQLESLKGLDKLRALKPGAEIVVRYAQGYAPVKSGELRDSIHYEERSDTVEVVADADHAVYVEMGTYKMRAQPYIRPAMENHTDEVLDAVSREVEAMVGEKVR